MGVTPEEVRRLASLARLDLADEEVVVLARQLSEILEHVDRLDPGGDHGAGAGGGDLERAPLRGDVPGPDALDAGPAAFAPEWRDGLFTVPRLASHDPGSGEAP